MEIKIIRSHRRRRTVGARLDEGVLLVSAPLMIPQARLDDIVQRFKVSFEKKLLKKELDQKQDLAKIAGGLNQRYFENQLKINSIEYVTTQNSRFGCCNFRDANIRVSHRVGLMPDWVRDYVLIHEMAHLLEPNHSKAFWDIVSRYELSERARGYLLAVGANKDYC